MSYRVVARKDYRDGIRSKLLWALMALFLVSVAGLALLFADDAPSGTVDSLEVAVVFTISAVPAILLLVPVTGLVVSIKSIVRERELGSIKIILSLPHSRRDVLVGKFIGRSGLLTTAILVGFVPAVLLLSVRFGAVPIYEFFVVTLMTVLFGVVFVAVGLSLSAFVSTETRATVGGFTAFFLLYLWSDIFGYLNNRLELLSGDALLFVERFELFTVFIDGAMALLSLRHGDIPSASTIALEAEAIPEEPGAVDYVSQPFYLQHWFAFVILAVWIVLPLAIAYWRFDRIDL